MAKQCDGAICVNCHKWNVNYITPNNDFHFCDDLKIFTNKLFYCSYHESKSELLERLNNNKFDEEYS